MAKKVYLTVALSLQVDGLDDLIEACKRWQRPEAVFADLDRALDRAYGKTQAQVHDETGGLRASGHTSTDRSPSEWSGTITYGGAGDVGRAAIHELERGGDHDLLRGLDEADIAEAFEAAIDRHFQSF